MVRTWPISWLEVMHVKCMMMIEIPADQEVIEESQVEGNQVCQSYANQRIRMVLAS